jgi:arylsulfatase A-like enzyme
MGNSGSNISHHLCIGVIVGVLGGALLGQLDGSLIILDELSSSFSFLYILTFLVFSACIYSVLCSFAIAMLSFAGCYVHHKIKKQLTDYQLLGIYSGAFFLAAISIFVLFNQSGLVSGFLKERIIGSLIVIFPAGLFIAATAGMGISYFYEKYHNKYLLQGVCLLLTAGIVLLADGLWLVLLNIHLLKNPSFTVRVAINVVSIFTFLAVLTVFLKSFARLRYINKTNWLTRALTIIILNCILVTAVEWSIAAFDPSAQMKTAAVSQHSSNESPDKDMRPNVLWIVMDTVRADHLSCYGYKHVTSPAIDNIAQEGLIFEKALAAAPWTLPSHASMFTGMYPRTHQTTNSHQYLSSSFTTIAELLRSHGYMTAGFSNNPWVSKSSNLNQGFDLFFEGFASAGDNKQWQRLLLVRLITRTFGVQRNDAGSQLQNWCSARQTNEQISRWLNTTWDQKTPFFMFINYMEAHLPYRAPEQYVQPFLPENISYETASKVNQNFIKYYAGLATMDKTDFAMLTALYDGEIHYLDYYMSNLFNELRSLGILDKTIVIITSDHGENLGDNNKMAHAFSVDDRLLHVPLIIRYPKRVSPGERVSRVVQINQIFPTILDIIGITGEGNDTLQVASLFHQPPSVESPAAHGFAELDTFFEGIQALINMNRNCFVDKYARGYTTIRDQNFKYILASDGAEEIYKLDDDPSETKNVLNRYPDKAIKLRLKMDAFLNSFDVPDLTLIDSEKARKADQQTLQGLRDLGYIQ